MTSFTADRGENLFGRASFKAACEEHDRCYGARGSSKHNCDATLQDGWVRRCESQYRSRCLSRMGGRCVLPSPDNPLREGCKVACAAFARLMSEAQRIDVPGWCPSCEAFSEAQGR